MSGTCSHDIMRRIILQGRFLRLKMEALRDRENCALTLESFSENQDIQDIKKDVLAADEPQEHSG